MSAALEVIETGEIVEQMTAEEASSKFMALILADALGQVDEFIVDGLDPRTSRALLAAAERHPSIRPALARARMHRDAAPPADRRSDPTTVYFIQQGDGGPIKVGVACDPTRRLAELQTGCPDKLRLLATRPGGIQEEHRLHAQFAQSRIRGEWFRPSVELIALIGESK